MADTNYITQQYRELLGRDPDAGGLAHYRGYSNPAAVRNSILGSAEYKNRSTAAATPVANPLQDFANQQKQASDALLARQNQEQEGLFSNYESIRKNQEALPALYNRLQTEAGIPELGQRAQSFKDEIYKTKDRLDRLSEDVTARTTGYNVSDAQRRRLETAEAEPLQTNLGRLGTGLAPIADMLSNAQNSVSTQLGLQTQQQDRELEPVKLRINAISDRFARELTGFNADRELQLTSVLDKLQRDRQLSDRDWELAQQLAAEERAYSRQKSLAATQLQSYNTSQRTTTPTTTATPKYSDWAGGSSVSIGGGPAINLSSTPGLRLIGGGPAINLSSTPGLTSLSGSGLMQLSTGGSYTPSKSTSTNSIPLFSGTNFRGY